MDKKTALEAYWRGHVDAWRASGLTQRAYCERHGVKCHSLSYWQLRKVPGEVTPEDKALTLVPATILPESQASMPSLVLCSPRGWRLELAALPPTDWLVALWGEQP